MTSDHQGDGDDDLLTWLQGGEDHDQGPGGGGQAQTKDQPRAGASQLCPELSQ